MNGRAYYNEIDGYAAQWLRNLIAAGHIAPGDVDERDIRDVRPDDLRGYTQCHFFAGIAGWSYALRLAGVPDDWTFSCPCQPLSESGERRGHADERHLWPAVHDLVTERRPSVMFGEQVASPLGLEWFAAVRADLEHSGYAVGCADLEAAAYYQIQSRQRLFFVAHRAGERQQEPRLSEERRPLVVRHTRPSVLSQDARFRCADDKDREIERGVLPIAPRVPGRLGRIGAYGNSINPQTAAEFIAAYLDPA